MSDFIWVETKGQEITYVTRYQYMGGQDPADCQEITYFCCRYASVTRYAENATRHNVNPGCKAEKYIKAEIAQARIEELVAANMKAAILHGEDVQRIEELAGLLKAASCPNCNGDGACYDNMGDIHQCQWCDETEKALSQEEK